MSIAQVEGSGTAANGTAIGPTLKVACPVVAPLFLTAPDVKPSKRVLLNVDKADRMKLVSGNGPPEALKSPSHPGHCQVGDRRIIGETWGSQQARREQLRASCEGRIGGGQSARKARKIEDRDFRTFDQALIAVEGDLVGVTEETAFRCHTEQSGRDVGLSCARQADDRDGGQP